MSKVRSEFWPESKNFIDWCTDEELVVLKQRIDKELAKRSNEFTTKAFKEKSFDEKYHRLANRYNVDIEDKGRGHIQIKGDKLVNYYPESKRRTAYIDGSQKGVQNVGAEQAVRMAVDKA